MAASQTACRSRACGYARTVSLDAVDSLLAAVDSSTQKCRVPMSAQQALDISGSSNIEITQANFSQFIRVDGGCYNEANVQRELQARLGDAAHDVAVEIVRKTRATQEGAEAIENVLLRMAVAAQGRFEQDCTTQINQIQGVVVENSSNVTLRFVRRTQVADVTRQCFFSSSDITSLRAELEEAIAATPAAREAGVRELLIQLAVVAAVTATGVGLVAWRGVALARRPLFWAGLTIPLLVMLLADYALGWPPYRAVASGDNSRDAQADRRWNGIILMAVIAATLVAVGAIAASLYVESRKARTRSP
jgi:hypothetical protein